MPHSQNIESIITKRHFLTEPIALVQKNIDDIVQQLSNLENARQQMIPKINDPQTIKKLEEINLTAPQESFKNEQKTLQKLFARFSRKTVNVGVVGRARQGKSTLLQNITGLTTAQIPSGNHSHCTGVRSIIRHESNVETHGLVYFHDQNSFIEEIIAPYYDELNLGNAPTNLSKFANQPLPILNDKHATANAMYEHLREYHTNFNQYANFLTNSSPVKIKQEHIRKYVAQDTIDGKRTNFAYLAVKKVEIVCSFPNDEVQGIAVIDMPGLGDTGVGDEERLMQTLGEDVDIILFVRKPNPDGDYWADVDVQLYDTAKDSLVELPLHLWSFMVLNRLAHGSNTHNCQDLRDTLAQKHIDVAGCLIANCRDSQDANQVLDYILDYLVDNITSLDEQYAASCQRRLLKIQEQVQIELKKAYSAIQTNQDKRLFKKSFNQLWSDLTNNLEELLTQVRANRHQEDEQFKQQVESILENCHNDNRLPTCVEAIEQKKKEFGTYTDAYCYYLPLIRTHLSLQLLSLDGKMQDSIEHIKQAIAEKLTEVGLGGLSINHSSDFLSSLTSQLPEDLTNLHSGFETIAQYNVSYAGIIQNRLRPHLDLLSPDKTPLVFSESLMYEELVESLSQIAPQQMSKIAQQSPSYEELQSLIRQEVEQQNITSTLEQEKALFLPNPNNSDIDSELLSQKLHTIHTKVLQECEKSLRELLKEPNQIIYSMTAEFVDRVLRADNVRDEWEIFLDSEEIRSKVWSEFKRLYQLVKQQEQWRNEIQVCKNSMTSESFRFLNTTT